MEFRLHEEEEEEEKVYNPTPLQQSASTMPSPSFSALNVAEARGAICGGGIRSHLLSTKVNIAADHEGDAALRYGECLRNHAASHGGHILDGCGEFMPYSNDKLKCAACNCHRSFHRKDVDADLSSELCDPRSGSYLLSLPHLQSPPHALSLQPYSSRGLLLRTGSNNGASVGEVTELSSGTLHLQQQQLVGSKKRFRTKFTVEQKEKMKRFAEKVGWRMQKVDDAEVEQFCGEAGVSRQVLKVWMHNNKNSMRKQQEDQQQRKLFED
ncbi:hypothetical protein Cni_G06510 [Canna indica]|uniref:Zinc finger-homeodomain protein 1 n=1 Tax=Canna indica TaxID=4628 RepID=A0AAQ3JZG5_9LILI|nr:hypothetical protein Cni_G06510 [Canna indica]